MIARLIGAAFGAGAVLVILFAGQPQAESPRLGASIALRGASGGAIELGAPRHSSILAIDSMRPGDPPAKGYFTLTNRAKRPVRVSLRLSQVDGRRPDRDLLAALRLWAGWDGRLTWGLSPRPPASRVGMRVAAGATVRVPLWLSLDPGAPPGAFAGRHFSLLISPVRRVLK